VRFAFIFVLLAMVAPASGIAWATDGPADGYVAEGVYRKTYGDLAIYAIADRLGRLDFSIVKGLSAQEIAKLASPSPELDKTSLTSYVSFFLIKSPAGLFVVDAGLGQADMAKTLEKAGFSGEEATDVLLTHFHGDHVNGLLAGPNPVFPKATVWASVVEDQYWLKDGAGGRGQNAAEKLAPYIKAGRYKTFEPGQEIKPGVKAVELYGHTPGHVGFLFESGDLEFLAWGDVVHAYLLQFARPDVTMTYDVDPQKAKETRAKVLGEAAERGYLVAGAHLPFPSLGQVKKGPAAGQGLSYVWDKELK
jgi:glyoxylase-like metal-dependent hydrolase (beta-lactamase superfamily II)